MNSVGHQLSFGSLFCQVAALGGVANGALGGRETGELAKDSAGAGGGVAMGGVMMGGACTGGIDSAFPGGLLSGGDSDSPAIEGERTPVMLESSLVMGLD